MNGPFRRSTILLWMSILVAPSLWGQKPDLEQRLQLSLNVAASKLRAAVQDLGDTLRFPRSTDSTGRWTTVHARDWTAGFFPGLLWNVGAALGDSTLLRSAERWTSALEPSKDHAGSHDIGFIMYCSFGAKQNIWPAEHDRDVLLHAARTLTTRYSPVVGCIRSWDRRRWMFPVIIDNMMNLELLLWAAENGGTPLMREIAVRHAEQTMLHHLRPDGSTFHVVSFDSVMGSVLERVTHQGSADSSAWARGQAWAIYGFTMVHRFTKDRRFLETAQRAADYFLSRLPDDNVPYWDFQAPGIPNVPRDAAAAAIAASGLIELGGVTPGERGARYRAAAGDILRSLASEPYLDGSNDYRGLIRHATGNMPSRSEIDVSLIYGDYYFVEAALRWKGAK